MVSEKDFLACGGYPAVLKKDFWVLPGYPVVPTNDFWVWSGYPVLPEKDFPGCGRHPVVLKKDFGVRSGYPAVLEKDFLTCGEVRPGKFLRFSEETRESVVVEQAAFIGGGVKIGVAIDTHALASYRIASGQGWENFVYLL